MRAVPLSGLAFVFTACLAAANDPAFTPEQVAFYEKDVKPLLKQHCFKCHGPDEKKRKAELNLTTRSGVLKGGDSGPAVSLDKPLESLLVKAITNKRTDGGDVMPPNGQLDDAQVAILKKWVEQKLPVPATDMGEAAVEHKPFITDEARKYWAYQPVVKSKLADSIDGFLKLKLDEKKLVSNPRAEKSVLVRRAYFDLLGLPPTPEQVDAFVNDTRPDAWEKLIDTLLKSPHYGEKWGRHWLDVVRYAETNGYERDGPKPHAWKYRDYVIRSFNADKPYDRFLKEQLAGDEMPWSADALIATGFYRLGLWDDEPADGQQALYDGYDDIVTVVGQGVLGMSLNCNRCHDHKKDPFPHSDYYRFLAFFRDIPPFSETRSVVSLNNTVDVTTPETKAKFAKDYETRQTEMNDIRAKMKPIEDEAIKQMSPEDQLAVQDGKRDQILMKLPLILRGDAKKQWTALNGQLKKLEKEPLPAQELAMGVNKCVKAPPPVFVLARGNPHAPKEKELCPPGFPAVLGVSDPVVTAKEKSSGRRTALAEWITSAGNPLTARVFVNRLWQHHFGKGIVGSPNDFGKLGDTPTHPELLDWLAADFVEHGWQIKRMHKLLMMSDAYQRSSTSHDANMVIDPANTLLWRFSMRRLGAEEVRDTMLSVGGQLKLDMGGPSVYPRIPLDVLQGQSRPGEGWVKKMGGGYDPAKPDEGNRRTIYVHVKRALQVPILATHDQADTDGSCPVRYTTTVPTQALGLLNGEFAHETATALAKRLEKEATPETQALLGIRLTTGRVPSAEEVKKDVAFMTSMKDKYKLSEATALQRYCLMLLNANEFLYVD